LTPALLATAMLALPAGLLADHHDEHHAP
jgi:hypothetical protein